MEYWTIILLGLPVLYMTGSLKKTVTNARIGGLAFVLFFLCVAALSILPRVSIGGSADIDIAGSFACASTAAYIAFKRRTFDVAFGWSLAVTVVMVVLAVSDVLILESFVLPYMQYAVCVIAVMGALAACRAQAPVIVPLMIGVYSIAKCSVETALGSVFRISWFNCVELVSISVCFCLFAAYFATRPRGRHVRRRFSRNSQVQISENSQN